MLSKAQIAEYQEIGAIVVPDVLSPEDVAEVRRVTEEMVKGAASLTKQESLNHPVYDLEETHTPQRPRVRRIKKCERAHEAYAKLARHPRIVAVLRDLLGEDIRFDTAKLNFKSAGYGAAVEWHQDWAFYPHTNDNLAAVGVMMDDMVLENGPLMILPGSHRGPTYSHHSNGYFVGAIDPETSGLDFSKAIPLVGKAGSVTVHHVRAVHGSALNVSDRDRRLLLFQYRAADAWSLPRPPTDIAAYDASIVSGVPREPRLQAGLDIRIPLPKTERADSIYESQLSMGKRYFDVVDPMKAEAPQARELQLAK